MPISFSLENPATWTGFLLPLLAAIASLVIGWFAARFAQHAVRRWLPRVGGNAFTIAPFAGEAVRYIILVFALITALGFLGIPSASILAVVGR